MFLKPLMNEAILPVQGKKVKSYHLSKKMNKSEKFGHNEREGSCIAHIVQHLRACRVCHSSDVACLSYNTSHYSLCASHIDKQNVKTEADNGQNVF